MFPQTAKEAWAIDRFTREVAAVDKALGLAEKSARQLGAPSPAVLESLIEDVESIEIGSRALSIQLCDLRDKLAMTP